MKLMKASLWASREFEVNSQPDNRTIKRWIETGKIQGRIIDERAYVFSTEKFGVDHRVSAHVNKLIKG